MKKCKDCERLSDEVMGIAREFNPKSSVDSLQRSPRTLGMADEIRRLREQDGPRDAADAKSGGWRWVKDADCSEYQRGFSMYKMGQNEGYGKGWNAAIDACVEVVNRGGMVDTRIVEMRKLKRP